MKRPVMMPPDPAVELNSVSNAKQFLTELPARWPTLKGNAQVDAIRDGRDALGILALAEPVEADARVRQFSELTKVNLRTLQKHVAEYAKGYNGNGGTKTAIKIETRPVFIFRKPSEWRDYTPPDGMVLLGDNHLVRGNVAVIGGEPGCGKSRATVALAQAGAICADWFGLKVHRKFKTLILQNENGGLRLKDEFSELDCAALDGYCRICDPPEYGMRFDAEDFCAALKTEVEDFQPDVVVLDPWNSVAMEGTSKDYLEAFRSIRAVIPAGETSPALVIVAHTRKPKGENRPTGRELLHELAGSYGLGSVPRTVFIMQHASADTEDNRIVWTCCKANDARQLGGRSAWLRCNGLFQPVQDFDWKDFDAPTADRLTITNDDLAEVFDHGKRELARKMAVAELAERTGCKTSACYNALKKYAKHLREHEGLLRWKA